MSSPDTTTAATAHRFFFDADCGVCTRLAQLMQRYAREPLELVPMHTVTPDAVGAAGEERFWASAHYIDVHGRQFHDGASVTRALRLLPGGRLLAVLDLPVVRRLRDAVYYVVARNRHHISRLLGLSECRI